jgi:putative cardiolipin synthase
LVLVILTACTTHNVPSWEPPPPQAAFPPPVKGALAELEAERHGRHGGDKSGFMLLDRNEEGLRWRLALIDTAVSSIDAQYYLWYGDAVGRILIQHLFDAADRGVRVRLLVDDLNTLLQTSAKVKLRDDVAAWVNAHPNIEIRLFNPWTRRDLMGRISQGLSDFKRINQRMHNKALIVDNRAAIIGGRNIGDEYMGLHAEFNFHDLDVLGIGPIARQSSDMFDRYWNSRWVVPVSVFDISVSAEEQADGRRQLRALLDATPSLSCFPIDPRSWAEDLNGLPEKLLPGKSILRADQPTEGGFDQLMLEEIRTMLASAETELQLVNAYIIPAEHGIDTLRMLNERGVRVHVLTNSLASQDVPAVNSHYRKWRKPILLTGASLYEIRHDAAIQADIVDTPPVTAKFMGLHSKAMVVDRRYVYIGSMNFDPRSASINTEMGAFIDSPELAAALSELILRDTAPENSWHVEIRANGKLGWVNDAESVTRQPARNFWQRVQDVVFRVFPEEYY